MDWSSIVSGVLFGSALYQSQVYQPHFILSQMALTDFHMVRVFVGATMGSIGFMSFAEGMDLFRRAPKPPRSLGPMGKYSANICGGSLVGVGMTLSGACPGTVLLQLAAGIKSGYYAFAGCLIGAFMYSALGKKTQHDPSPDDMSTVDRYLQVSYKSAALSFICCCSALLYLLPDSEAVGSKQAIIFGLGIAAAQSLTILFTKSSVGISSVYPEIISALERLWRTGSVGAKSLGKPISFASGIVLGALAMNFLDSSGTSVSTVDIGKLRAATGGVALVLGARIAGGCTSGHGISGIAQLSLSSFVTVAMMFAGGIGSALFVL